MDEFAAQKNAINILLQNMSEDDVFYPPLATVRISLRLCTLRIGLTGRSAQMQYAVFLHFYTVMFRKKP